MYPTTRRLITRRFPCHHNISSLHRIEAKDFHHYSKKRSIQKRNDKAGDSFDKNISNPVQRAEPGNIPSQAETSSTPKPSTFSMAPTKIPWQQFQSMLTPVRYRNNGYGSYFKSRELLEAIAWRLPLALAGVWVISTTFPVLTIHGPSMIPTLAPDGSEIYWAISLKIWPFFQRGDLVGFAPPTTTTKMPQGDVSVKRVVGIAGDEVPRYGQYALLYVDHPHSNHDSRDQDTNTTITKEESVPIFGIPWNLTNKDKYAWVDTTCPWDDQVQSCHEDKHQEARRTLVVPPGHVWLEADCPGMGIDSRQLGPIPVEWLQAKIMGRLWPLTGSRASINLFQRPFPVSLKDDELKRYNVQRVATVTPTLNHDVA